MNPQLNTCRTTLHKSGGKAIQNQINKGRPTLRILVLIIIAIHVIVIIVIMIIVIITADNLKQVVQPYKRCKHVSDFQFNKRKYDFSTQRGGGGDGQQLQNMNRNTV
jgi:hypothetical protein